MREKEFKRWLLSHDYSLTTIERAIRYVRYIEERGLQVDNVKDEDEVLEFIAREREKGVSPKTLNNYVKQLNRYFQFRGVDIKLNYFKDYGDSDMRIPSDEDVRKILNLRWAHYDIDLRNRTILHLLFATGLRVNEMINLDWKDLYYDNTQGVWMLNIRMGKGRKPRKVPVPPKVVDMLFEWKKVQPKSDPNAMFTTYRGRISHAYFRKIIKIAAERVGIPWFHAHLARHWRAIKFLEEGVNLETIRRYLGHSSLKTTQIYLSKLEYTKSVEEIKRKDTFFGKWSEPQSNLGAPPEKIEKSEVRK